MMLVENGFVGRLGTCPVRDRMLVENISSTNISSLTGRQMLRDTAHSTNIKSLTGLMPVIVRNEAIQR
jgi:hypothetical protein